MKVHRKASKAAARSNTSPARARRGLGPATRTPSQAWAQLCRVTGHPTYPKLGGRQQSTIVELVKCCDQDAMTFVGIDLLAERLGIERGHVSRHLTALDAVGMISFPEGRSRGNQTSLIRVDAALDHVENDAVTHCVENDTVTMSKTTQTTMSKSTYEPKEGEPEKETDDDARETSSSSMTDETRALRVRLIDALHPSRFQLALIDEGLTVAPMVVEACIDVARDGDRPGGLFFRQLEAAKARDWTAPPTPLRRKRGTAAQALAAKARAEEAHAADGVDRTGVSIFDREPVDPVEAARSWWRTTGIVYPDGFDELRQLYPNLTDDQAATFVQRLSGGKVTSPAVVHGSDAALLDVDALPEAA